MMALIRRKSARPWTSELTKFWLLLVDCLRVVVAVFRDSLLSHPSFIEFCASCFSFSIYPRWIASGTLVMDLDHSALKSDNTLQAALSAFAKKPLYSPLDKRLNPPENGQGKKKKLTRFVVLKAFETVPPSLQMLLVHRFADTEDMGLRFIFVADDAKSVHVVANKDAYAYMCSPQVFSGQIPFCRVPAFLPYSNSFNWYTACFCRLLLLLLQYTCIQTH